MNFGLADPLQRALVGQGYTTPTPIQERSIPALLEGRDMLGIAQTGTGKTAAFALPILNAIALNPKKVAPKTMRALILAPTRELVVQIAESIRHYGKHIKLRTCAVFGGVSELHQIKAMSVGVDVLIATPGRLMDLANRRHIKFDAVEMFVLDEADRMLDMGFIREVNKITAMLPEQRQSLLFSATMPKEISHLAERLLNDPVRVEVTPKVVTVERIDQKVFFVDGPRKRELLLHLLQDEALSRVVVFTRTKHAANKVSEHLEKAGVSADAIHGNKSQNARQHALNNFKSGKARVLVATDIAARGIHVSDISHVINYELPNQPESYVHRIGRTARAGADGIAFSFCDRLEKGFLKDIERFTKRQIPVAEHAFSAPADPGAKSDSRDGRRAPKPPREPRSFAGGNRDRDAEREQRHGGGRHHRGEGRSRFENRSHDAAETFNADASQGAEHQGAERQERHEHRGEKRGGGRFEHRGERKEFRGERKEFRGPRQDRGENRNEHRGEHRGERSEHRGERNEHRGDRKDFRGPRQDRGERKEFRNHEKRGDRFENRNRHEGRNHEGRTEQRHDRDEMTRAQQDRSHAERHFGNTKHEQRQREVREQGEHSRGEFRGPKRHGKPHGGKPHGQHQGQRNQGQHNQGQHNQGGGDRPLQRKTRHK
ncbi:MAG: DEAD/DEAH box helicase [Rhodospirillaceae bacterium]|nr:DEAD/DEAH box helicase [Rhodospirillaceae bacterium]